MCVSSRPRAGTPDTFFIKYLLEKAASCKDFGILVIDISVACTHARTEQMRKFTRKFLQVSRVQDFETRGSSEWNEEIIKALARVLI